MDPMTIITAVTGIMNAIDGLIQILEAKKLKREMTPEEEKAYDELVALRMKADHWQKKPRAKK